MRETVPMDWDPEIIVAAPMFDTLEQQLDGTATDVSNNNLIAGKT